MTQSTTQAPHQQGLWAPTGLPGQRSQDAAVTIDTACRTLGLGTIRGRWEEMAQQALREHAFLQRLPRRASGERVRGP